MGRLSILRFLREQWTAIPLVASNLHGKSVVITGATGGLGLETALHLAKMDPSQLTLTYRDLLSSNQKQQSQLNGPNITTWPLDLASFDSVRDFVDRYEKKTDGDGLYSLIANGAKATRTYEQTGDGWESTLQVNYLSNALLSILLLPHLIKASSSESASRLIFISSDGHYSIDQSHLPGGSHILRTLNDEGFCSPSVMKNRYNVSKVLVMMFIRELVARLKQPVPVVITSVNPGFCHSRLTREAESKLATKWMVRLLKHALARSSEIGSRTIVHAVVCADEGNTLHGRYVSCCAAVEESDYLLSTEGKETSSQIWQETLEILSQVDSRVDHIVATHLQ